MIDKEMETGKSIRRKIQVVGGSTITVSLPRRWIKKYNIGRNANQNGEISMRYRPDGSLMLFPSNQKMSSTRRISSHRFGRDVSVDEIKRTIIADFIAGVDTINMRLKEPLELKDMSILQDFVVRSLIGFEIIDEEKKITITNMTQSPIYEVNRLLELIKVKSTRMVSKCYKWMNNPSIEKSSLILNLENGETELDRLSYHMMRTLQLCILDYWMAEQVDLQLSEVLHWSAVNRSAESATDVALSIARVSTSFEETTDEEKEILNELSILGDTLSDLYTRALNAFIKSDSKESHKILNIQEKHSITRQGKWPVMVKSTDNPDLVVITRNLDKIGVYIRKIAEATIDCESARKLEFTEE
jgi:phosphate uptake regulator